jgi:hypothetical protein
MYFSTAETTFDFDKSNDVRCVRTRANRLTWPGSKGLGRLRAASRPSMLATFGAGVKDIPPRSVFIISKYNFYQICYSTFVCMRL